MLRVLIIFLLALLPVCAQIVPGRYIVELSAEPALSGVSAKVRAASADRIAAVRAGQDRLRAAVSGTGARVTGSVELISNALFIEAGEAEAAAIAALPGVRRVHPVRLARKYLDRAVLLQHATEAWQFLGGMSNAGRGVKIGIIDSGIDSSHPGLQDAELTAPDGFPKVNRSSDTGHTNGKVIVARNYDDAPLSNARDRDGHGTAVAMIAAGNTVAGPRGSITGIAPKAWLGNYKVFPDNSETAPTDAIMRALDDAVADGMDVINLSLGSYPTELPEDDAMVRAVERVTAAGVIVVVAGGNEGPDPATIGSPGTAASVITVGNAANDRIFASTVRLADVDPYVALAASGSGNRAAVNASMRDVTEFDPSGLACSSLPANSLTGVIALILRGTCLFEDKLRNAQAAGALAAVVYSHADSPDPVAMDAGRVTLPAVMISNTDGLDLKKHIEASAGQTVQVTFSPTAVPSNPAHLSSSSSRGPNIDGGIKPDLLAVGSSIYTAAPSTVAGASFQIASGTSLSSPMVAGAAAVLKAARPGLTAQQYRSLLINTSGTFSYDSVSPAPIQHTGAGLLHVLNALRSTVAASPASVSFGAGSGTAAQTVELTLTNLGTVDDTFTIAAQSLGAGPAPVVEMNAVTLAGGASRAVPVRFELSNAPAGQYQGFLVIRSSTTDVETRVPWWYGVRSDVVASLTIAEPSEAGATGSTQQFLVRPSDATGLAVDVVPTATAVEGGGTVVRVGRARSYPGFFIVEVRLGPSPGPNVFEVSASGKTTRLTVTGE